MVAHRGGSLVVSRAGEWPWKPLTLGLLVLVNNKPLSFQPLWAGYSVTNLSILKGIKILEQCFLSNVLECRSAQILPGLGNPLQCSVLSRSKVELQLWHWLRVLHILLFKLVGGLNPYFPMWERRPWGSHGAIGAKPLLACLLLRWLSSSGPSS